MTPKEYWTGYKDEVDRDLETAIKKQAWEEHKELFKSVLKCCPFRIDEFVMEWITETLEDI